MFVVFIYGAVTYRFGGWFAVICGAATLLALGIAEHVYGFSLYEYLLDMKRQLWATR